MSEEVNKHEPCTVCKGSGKQTFNGLADTFKATCGFCGGDGTRQSEIKWYDSSFKERGLR